MHEIDTLEAFDAWAADPACGPAAVQAVDLCGRTEVLCQMERPGSLFFACEMCDQAAGHLVMNGAVVVPDLGKAFTVHRSTLYAAEELYDTYDPERPESYEDCLDRRVYLEYLADSKFRPDVVTGFARAAHDHSVSSALDDLIDGRRVVAIMGGHGLERSCPQYAQVVRLAKALSERDYLVTSGGGPGAMEATHLGAWLAGYPDSTVGEVLHGPFVRRPAGAPVGHEYADADWLARAWKLRQTHPRLGDVVSVGIPTWLYGHEPPTPFATHIAKYFANSIREDGVLAIATHGVIFAPGSAGTTQEVFQDACQNHYATTGVRSPMVLLDSEFWTHERPVWDLLTAVSEGEIYGELVTMLDADREVLRFIQNYEPSWYRVSAVVPDQLEADLRRGMKLRANWALTAVKGLEPAGPPAGWRAVLAWLHGIGDDDWINVERGHAVLPALCADWRVHAVDGGVVFADDRGAWTFTALLRD